MFARFVSAKADYNFIQDCNRQMLIACVRNSLFQMNRFQQDVLLN